MTKRRLTAIRLDKIAAVDLPCQEHATVAIIKRAPVPAGDPQTRIIKATFQQALTGCLLADQVREAFYSAFDNMYDGQQAFRTALIDELSAGGDGSTASDAYKAWVTGLIDKAVVGAKAAGAATLTPEDLAKAFNAAAADWLKQQETTMVITDKAQLSAAIEKAKAGSVSLSDLATIKKAAVDLNAVDMLPAELAPPTADPALAALQRENAVLKMAPAIRKHFDGLAAEAQTAFIAKSATEQQAIVDSANAEDPVVFTTSDGEEIRKSAGPAMIAMAKRLDKAMATIENLTNESTASSIEKRAAGYPNLAVNIVKSQLRVIDGMPEAERPAALAALTALNKQAGGTFRTIGTTFGDPDIGKGVDSVEGKMGVIVKRIAKERGISEVQATVFATADPEYQELYREQVAAQPSVAAAPGE